MTACRSIATVKESQGLIPREPRQLEAHAQARSTPANDDGRADCAETTGAYHAPIRRRGRRPLHEKPSSSEEDESDGLGDVDDFVPRYHYPTRSKIVFRTYAGVTKFRCLRLEALRDQARAER